jgi:hypothetical protein
MDQSYKGDWFIRLDESNNPSHQFDSRFKFFEEKLKPRIKFFE